MKIRRHGKACRSRVSKHIWQKLSEWHKQKQKLAQSVGFDAYGTSSETLDPVATAIHGLIEHIHALDKRLESMSTTIEHLGGEVPAVEMPELDKCELNIEETKSS